MRMRVRLSFVNHLNSWLTSNFLQGDSGGLLTCGKICAGLVSFGNECGLPSFPGNFSIAVQVLTLTSTFLHYPFVSGIYSDVSIYNDWIDKTVSTKDLPDYEHSPFPKPRNFSDINEKHINHGKSSTTKQRIAPAAAVFFILFLISRFGFGMEFD